jgi:hypothetical protein
MQPNDFFSGVLTFRDSVARQSTEFKELQNYLLKSYGQTHHLKYQVIVNPRRGRIYTHSARFKTFSGSNAKEKTRASCSRPMQTSRIATVVSYGTDPGQPTSEVS